jgi:toxin FitB
VPGVPGRPAEPACGLGVLDTDVASALLRRRASALLLRILDGSIPAVTFVTIGELRKWTPVRQAL